jgi:phosphatidylinositol alpha-1,6-mannosyltransferase
MPEMMQKIPNLKYVVVGDGSDLERLKGVAVNQGLKYQVIFTGPVPTDSDAKSFYYQLGHIFITASLKPEGFGISYIEAQATKTPVIASKFGGSAEAVKDGETGILVNPSVSSEIAAAIYRLVEDRELWEKMSTAGVAWAKGFDWELQLEKIKKTIEEKENKNKEGYGKIIQS